MRLVRYILNEIKKAFQGECVCQDCGKKMSWDSSEWTLINAHTLLCTSCVMARCKKGRLL
jgi:hypothetical protein